MDPNTQDGQLLLEQKSEMTALGSDVIVKAFIEAAADFDDGHAARDAALLRMGEAHKRIRDLCANAPDDRNALAIASSVIGSGVGAVVGAIPEMLGNDGSTAADKSARGIAG